MNENISLLSIPILNEELPFEKIQNQSEQNSDLQQHNKLENQEQQKKNVRLQFKIQTSLKFLEPISSLHYLTQLDCSFFDQNFDFSSNPTSFSFLGNFNLHKLVTKTSINNQLGLLSQHLYGKQEDNISRFNGKSWRIFTSRLQATEDPNAQLLSGKIAQICLIIESKLSSLVRNQQKPKQQINKHQIQEVLQKLSFKNLAYLDPIGNKKIYERYKQATDDEIWKIGLDSPAAIMRFQLDLPIVSRAQSKNIQCFLKQCVFKKHKEKEPKIPGVLSINQIDYNYKFLKLKFGNVNIATYELLKQKIPHFCYPIDHCNQNYFTAEYLIFKLKLDALTDGKHHKMEEKVCIEGYIGQKWKASLNYYERHFLSLKKFEGIIVLYFTDIEKIFVKEEQLSQIQDVVEQNELNENLKKQMAFKNDPNFKFLACEYKQIPDKTYIKQEK